MSHHAPRCLGLARRQRPVFQGQRLPFHRQRRAGRAGVLRHPALGLGRHGQGLRVSQMFGSERYGPRNATGHALFSAWRWQSLAGSTHRQRV
eukprot:4726435-Prymnesium_polylepis.2